MTDLTLRQLRYFDALARHLNFGRAAAECAVTQPALSMQIADFEAKLGVALVERTRQGISLTTQGEAAQKRIQRILGEVRDLAEYARRQGRLAQDLLKLGVIPSIAPYVLPRLLPHLREAHPDLRLHLRETLTRFLIGELIDGQLDLVLLALPVEEPGIETLALIEDRFLLAVPRSQGPMPSTSVAEVAQRENLLLLEEGHCLRDQTLEYCGLREASSMTTLGVSSISTIVQMVGNGYGVTLLPEMAAAMELAHSPVKVLAFAAPEPKRIVGLAWRASSPRKAEFMAYGRLIKASVRGREGSSSE